MSNRAEQIREEIDVLLCEYVERYGQDASEYDYSQIDEAINEISGGINPMWDKTYRATLTINGNEVDSTEIDELDYDLARDLFKEFGHELVNAQIDIEEV